MYNGDFVNSEGNYQLYFVNDHLYSIMKILFSEEKNIAENYYEKWKLELKAKDKNYPGDNKEEKIRKGVKQFLFD